MIFRASPLEQGSMVNNPLPKTPIPKRGLFSENGISMWVLYVFPGYLLVYLLLYFAVYFLYISLNIGLLKIKPVPIERALRELSIDTGFGEIGFL